MGLIEEKLEDLAQYNFSEILIEKLNKWLCEEDIRSIKEKLKEKEKIEKFKIQSVLSSDAWRRLTGMGTLPYLVAKSDGSFYLRGFKGRILCSRGDVEPGKIYFKDIKHDNFVSVVILRVED